MARKTKAELAAEREAALAEYKAAKEADYPALLMDTLERATKLSYELTVEATMFVVRDLNSNAKWTMSLVYTNDSQDTLEALVYDVQDTEDLRAEAERRYQAKQAALAKLSKEERELLGL